MFGSISRQKSAPLPHTTCPIIGELFRLWRPAKKPPKPKKKVRKLPWSLKHLITDGLPSYIEAIQFLNKEREKDDKIKHIPVIGLENNGEV